MAPINKKLQQWALEAIDLGFACFSDGDHAPFILLVDEAGKRILIRLQSASGVIDSKLVEEGRRIIHGLESGRFYGLVWDGYLTTDKARQEAVFVEAATHGGTQALVFAQPYKRKRRSRRLEKVGQPLVAGKAPHQWS
jgi:hypothetical protein